MFPLRNQAKQEDKGEIYSFLKTVFTRSWLSCWLKASYGYEKEKAKLCSSITIVHFPYRAC